MKHRVGFRKIAVHCDQNIQKPILQAIIVKHPADFETVPEEPSL